MRDLHLQAGAAAMAVLAGVAVLLPRPWLRSLLGATAAGLLVLACLPSPLERLHRPCPVAGLACRAGVLAAGAWAAAVGCRRRCTAWAGLEPFATGWLAATLAGLAWWAGMSFLVGAQPGWRPGGRGGAPSGQRAPDPFGAGFRPWSPCWPCWRRAGRRGSGPACGAPGTLGVALSWLGWPGSCPRWAPSVWRWPCAATSARWRWRLRLAWPRRGSSGPSTTSCSGRWRTRHSA
jgi:hypothetical protein